MVDIWQSSVGCLVILVASSAAQAGMVNFDFTSLTTPDAYGPGSAVFGNASSQWNIALRTTNFVDLPLFDESGAATTITITTGRTGSGSNTPSGAFQDLGSSHQSSSLVTISCLTPFTPYDLVFFTPQALGWDVLTEGTHYTLQSGSTSAGGTISFAPTSGRFSGFQLQTVPEPTALPLFAIGAAILNLRRRRKQYGESQ